MKKPEEDTEFDSKLEQLRKLRVAPSREFRESLEKTLLSELSSRKKEPSRRFTSFMNGGGILRRVLLTVGVVTVGAGGVLAFNEEVRNSVEDVFDPKGSLIVTSPELEVLVEVDSESYGITPTEIPRLDTGLREVTISAPDFVPLTRFVEIEARKTTFVDLDINQDGQLVFSEKGKEYSFVLEPDNDSSYQEVENAGWAFIGSKTDTYEFKIEYPPSLFRTDTRPSGPLDFEQHRFVSRDGGIKFALLIDDIDPEITNLEKLYNDELVAPEADIESNELSRSSYTVEGTTGAGNRFYTKRIFSGDIMYTLNFNYESNLRSEFKPIMERIVDSLEVEGFEEYSSEGVDIFESRAGDFRFMYPEGWVVDNRDDIGVVLLRSHEEVSSENYYELYLIVGEQPIDLCLNREISSEQVEVEGVQYQRGLLGMAEDDVCAEDMDLQGYSIDVELQGELYQFYIKFTPQNSSDAWSILKSTVASFERVDI